MILVRVRPHWKKKGVRMRWRVAGKEAATRSVSDERMVCPQSVDEQHSHGSPRYSVESTAVMGTKDVMVVSRCRGRDPRGLIVGRQRRVR